MIVLDCSAAVSIARETLEGKALHALILGGERVISSELFPIEAASAFGKYVRANTLDESTAKAYLVATVALVDELIPIQENYIEAFHESLRLKHSVYAMLYFTLARRNAATLVTLDTKLMELCEQQGVDCIQEIDF